MTSDSVKIEYTGKYHWGADQDFWRDPDLSCSEKIVWILLRSAASMRDGVKITVLARWAKRYEAGIIKDLKSLISAGYLKREFIYRRGAIVERVIYKLYDTPQNSVKTETRRISKNAMRVSHCVNRNEVKSKSVKSRLVKTSSPSPPRGQEEKKIDMPQLLPLPQPFSNITAEEAEEAGEISSRKGLNLRDQVTALACLYRGKDVPKPGNLLLKVLRTGGVVNAAGIATKCKATVAKEAEEAEKTRKRIRDAHAKAEIPRWMR